MRLLIVGIACLSLTACFTPTRPVPSASPEVQQASSVINAAAVTPRAGAGAVVVTRDTGMAAKACTFDVSIDGQLAAGLRAGQQVTLYADPGERIIRITVRESYCGKQLAQIAVQVLEGATKRVRIGVDASLDLRLEQSAY